MFPSSGVVNVTGGGSFGGSQCVKIIFKNKEVEKEEPYCEITATPDHIVIHEDPLLEWNSTNATSATLNQGIGSVEVNGTYHVFPEETTTYTLTVSGPGGEAQCSVTVTVEHAPPACDIWADPETVEYGGDVLLDWWADNAESASLNQGIGSVDPGGSYVLENVTQTKTYTLTIHGLNGETVQCSTTVYVDQEPSPEEPSCDIWASETNIENGDSTTLSWVSDNADSASINQGVGSVVTQGSRAVSPDHTVTYTLTVYGDDASAQCRVTITVDEPEEATNPSCDIWASDTHTTDGESATISWESENATSASISGIGSVSTGDSRSVSPHVTKTYTLTVWDDEGNSEQCSVTIVVEEEEDEEEPSCWIAASPTTVDEGEGTTLTWDSENASSASISSIGSVNVSGSRSVNNLYSSKTYTLTVRNGDGETAQCETTVHVDLDDEEEEPSCWINASPSSIDEGESANLTWNSDNADSASLSSVGSVGVNGAYTVYPNATKTYTLTVYGDGGSAECQTTVHVDYDDDNDYDRPSCDIYQTQNSSSWWNAGSAVRLSWDSDNADRATLSSHGNVPTDGSKTVYPSRTTTYTLTVWGDGGTEQCSTTVRVDDDHDDNDHDRPSCTIQLSDRYGNGTSRLSWWSSDANRASISNIGSVNTSDSMTVYPDGNRAYTMTVSGPGGTATCHTSYVTPYLPPIVGQPYINLTQIPYTGFDFGPIGNAMYWLGMIVLAVAGAQLILHYRGNALVCSGHAVAGKGATKARAFRKRFRFNTRRLRT